LSYNSQCTFTHWLLFFDFSTSINFTLYYNHLPSRSSSLFITTYLYILYHNLRISLRTSRSSAHHHSISLEASEIITIATSAQVGKDIICIIDDIQETNVLKTSNHEVSTSIPSHLRTFSWPFNNIAQRSCQHRNPTLHSLRSY
jgi:hypothetical protein